MSINRAIWLSFFVIGLVLLGLVVLAVDAWAFRTAMPGFESYCRGTLVAHVPLERTPLCFALWFTEAKSWMFYARDTLLQAQQGLYSHDAIRAADVSLFAIGSVAGGFALAGLWASAMTRLVISTMAVWYTLLHGLSHILAGRRPA